MIVLRYYKEDKIDYDLTYIFRVEIFQPLVYYNVILKSWKLRLFCILKWYNIEKYDDLRVSRLISISIKIWYKEWGLEYEKKENLIKKRLDGGNQCFFREYMKENIKLEWLRNMDFSKHTTYIW
jgi:hypothetical protein